MLNFAVNEKDYHLAELKVALDSAHPKHILPPPLAASFRVLDVGCGAGQTLIASYPDRVTFGLDQDIEALRLGSSLTGKVRFVCGRAEALPYKSEQFDFVVARVSLPYTNINASLKEIRRVLRPSGSVWITLNSFSIPWKAVRTSNWKGKVFFAYILFNSIAFHLFQKNFSLLGRYESFQTERGITQALRRSNFEEISISRPGHFLVTARRSSA